MWFLRVINEISRAMAPIALLLWRVSAVRIISYICGFALLEAGTDCFIVRLPLKEWKKEVFLLLLAYALIGFCGFILIEVLEGELHVPLRKEARTLWRALLSKLRRRK